MSTETIAAVIARLHEAVKYEANVHILDRCAHYDLLVDALRVIASPSQASALRAKAAEWRERGRVMAGYSEQTRIVNARDGAAYASGRAVSLQECADELDALAATLSSDPSAQTSQPSDT